MLYLDASALVKRYVYEDGAAVVFDSMNDDHEWTTSVITRVEVGRTVARSAADGAVDRALVRYHADARLMHEVELTPGVRDDAEQLAISTGLKSLDAIHLASAMRAGGPELTMLTFDDELAHAARGLGIPVIP